MDQLLGTHTDYCHAFTDGIFIYPNNADEHFRHLRTILALFQKKKIAISPAKFFVGYPNVELLGFRVDNFDLTNTTWSDEACEPLSFPSNLNALKQYFDTAGFHRHLIPYFAKLSEPLQRRKVEVLAQGY
ncbi:hypothetical protein C7999DRAFT_15815 [Corynascus novoguineensis]|uniref:Reverse transcriptase domain-containing protein n=1 Tax=Corynascus novoguineensis TaxID=1126955 RepID=A0AAN7CSF6_9PEZI|nr:hypothetical protein C7999DRAFT_15815 [Corynascus novoguineensis]